MLGAQSNTGAAFLLVPIAARSVGVAGASVADVPGTEAVVTNPAALGHVDRREAALHVGQDAASKRLLATVVLPSRVLGAFSVAAYLADYGAGDLVSGAGEVVGRIYPRDVFYAATYASDIGRRLAVGVTYRYVQNRFDCTGQCINPEDGRSYEQISSTSSVDVGARYEFGPRVPLSVGAAVRHFGFRLQIEDREQADALPTQLALGARYVVPGIARYVPDGELRLLGEAVGGLAAELSNELRLGVEGVYRSRFVVRGGYAVARGGGLTSGPAFGLGYAGPRFALDLARQVGGLSSAQGQPPTYASLRYWF